MTSIEPGRDLLGKYRVLGVIGRGGMGVVLRAVHVELDTRVAVKVLHASDATAPDVAGRFLREAQAASRLRSEFVARVTDYGRIDDGRPCMVMELLEGEDYQALLARGALPPADAVDAIVQAAAALAEAHAAGIVHRDVKPSNLFRTVRPDGSFCTKVLDFGISKVADPLSPQAITETGHVLGTPLYMSPEQVRSPREIDARTDVWSLGVVLYEMLAGAPPFQSDTMGQLFARILESEPPPLAARRPGVPSALAEIVHRCLEKDRDRRVASMRDLAELLAPFASHEGAMAARRAGVLAPRGDEPSLASPSGGGTSSAEASALAETLEAAATASEKSADTPAAPAATQPSGATPPAVRAPDTASGAGRTRLSIPLVAACIATVAVGVAVLGLRGEVPPSGPAAPGAAPVSSIPPATTATALTPTADPPAPAAATPTAVPAVTPTATLSGTASTAAPAASASSAPAPAASATSSAGPRRPTTAAPAGGRDPRPPPTTLW